METVTLLICILILAALLAVLAMLISLKNKNSGQELNAELEKSRSATVSEVKNLIGVVSDNQKNTSEMLKSKEETLIKLQSSFDERFGTFTQTNEQTLSGIRKQLAESMKEISENNEKKLEQMRLTVDEKLEKTLNARITESFKTVSDQLKQVYDGLGEMKTLATGVGDLKKVLSNVKTRGILGEIQLGAILEEMLSPEQYVCDVATKKDSRDRVEYAVRLPGSDNGAVLLPIDAKFPAETYNVLLEAYDSSDSERIKAARKALEIRIKGEAKDIKEKYVSPPETTDFGIMFLPTEGLYAEVVRLGLVETLQREYKINIAGPTTMAALLNSLQMGFRTLAIQKRSSEVWEVLGAVKSEFEKFGGVLETSQKQVESLKNSLEKLAGTRTNVIMRKLKDVEVLPLAQPQGERADIDYEAENN